VGGVEAWIQGQYLLHGLFLNPSHVKYFNTPNFFIYFFLQVNEIAWNMTGEMFLLTTGNGKNYIPTIGIAFPLMF
jgi:hypothetical protein